MTKKKKENTNLKSAEDWTKLGKTYLMNDQLNKALECYKCAIEINPNYFNAWADLIEVYEKKGEHTKAEEVFEKAYQIEKKYINESMISANEWYLKKLEKK
jgi:Tfp pilus assembly protein PilF